MKIRSWLRAYPGQPVLPTAAVIAVWGFLMFFAAAAGAQGYINGKPALDAVRDCGPAFFAGLIGIAGSIITHRTARFAYDQGVLRSLRHVLMFQKAIMTAGMRVKNDMILEGKMPVGAEPDFSIPPESLDALHNIIADTLVPHLGLAERNSGPKPGATIH